MDMDIERLTEVLENEDQFTLTMGPVVINLLKRLRFAGDTFARAWENANWPLAQASLLDLELHHGALSELTTWLCAISTPSAIEDGEDAELDNWINARQVEAGAEYERLLEEANLGHDYLISVTTEEQASIASIVHQTRHH